MKYRIPKVLTLTLSLALLSSVNAQEVRIGGGYNVSNVNKAGTERWVGKAGYQFGADVLLGNRFFFKPGIHFMVRNLNYSSAGADPNGGAQVQTVEYRYTDRWLMVPVLVGVRLLDPEDDHAVNVYVQAGPTALFKLNVELDNNVLSATTNAAQWYIGGGAGMEIKFIFIEAGYNVAMSNVFKSNDSQTTINYPTTNPKVNQFYISAGVRLKLAK